MSEKHITTRRRISRTKRSHSQVRVAVDRPVLHVLRSNKHIYAQIVDHTGKVLAASSDIKLDSKLTNIASAEAVGTEIAKKATSSNVTQVAFNRRGYRYHGRVKALADAARAGGLVF